jgi:archaellum component FlaC
MAGTDRAPIYDYLDDQFGKVYNKIDKINDHSVAMERRLQHIEDRATPSVSCVEYFSTKFGEVSEKCHTMTADVNAVAEQHRQEIAAIKVDLAKKPEYGWVRAAIGAAFGIVAIITATIFSVIEFFGRK